MLLDSIAPEVSYVDHEWGQVWGRKVLSEVVPARLQNITPQEHAYYLADNVSTHLKQARAHTVDVTLGWLTREMCTRAHARGPALTALALMQDVMR